MRLVVTTVTLLLAAACGGEAANPEVDAGAGIDAPLGPWEVLMSKAWSLPAGSETMEGVGLTLDHDVYVRAIRPIAPPGTHHTLLGIGTNGGTDPDGLIYASGVGSDALYMPPRVGYRLVAGTQLSLQLHLYNTGDDVLTGTSGIEVITTTAEDVDFLAEIQLDGPLGLNIPPGVHSQAGACSVGEPTSVFAVFPHMHKLGTHLRTWVTTPDGDVELHDGPYAFEEQRIIPVAPIALVAGDTIHTECTWNNTTGAAVGWGQSSDDEMCFSIVFKYPATGNAEFCGG